MPVFAVSWTEGEYSQSYEQIAYFTTRELAEASCPSDGAVTEIEIRDEPLRVAVRYRGWIDTRGKTPKVKIEEARYCEWQTEFSEPMRSPSYGYGSNLVEGPDRAKVEKRMEKHLAEAIEKKNREARDALRRAEYERTHTKVSCPEHGVIGSLPNDSPLSYRCPKCGRVIDVAGNVGEVLSEVEFTERLRAMRDDLRAEIVQPGTGTIRLETE